MWVTLTLRAGGSIHVRIGDIIAGRAVAGGTDIYLPGHVVQVSESLAQIGAAVLGRPHTLTVLE